MANPFNAIIAVQTANWRGSSVVTVRGTTALSAQNVRAIAGACYGLKVSGGVSGTFGVFALGYVGGSTYVLAGVTNVTAAGNYIFYPVGYSSTGAPGVPGDIQSSVSILNRIDQIVPPSHIVFQSAVATVGISAACTVGLVMTARSS